MASTETERFWSVGSYNGAIREAVTRPTMRFVAIKTIDQQAALMLHKTCDLLVGQRTMLINALSGHLAEFWIIAAKKDQAGRRPPSRLCTKTARIAWAALTRGGTYAAPTAA